MLFPDDALFDYVLDNLTDEMADYAAPIALPMPCDRWLARSGLQKACRRGDTGVALAALANLFEHDRYAIWRHLTVITLEDVSVANIDLLARIVAAAADRPWRTRMGGDWAVGSYLVRKICESNHCQAACDLLLRAINDPALDTSRADALDADISSLADMLRDTSRPIVERGIAALAIGGGLVDGQEHHDPCAVFDILADGPSSHVVATCRAAWKRTKNEMALLMPLVWTAWMANDEAKIEDDTYAVSPSFDGVPAYAIDQFTRVGGQVARAYLAADPIMSTALEARGIPRTKHPRVVGDLIFLAEGSVVSRRVIWHTADQLRKPHRMLFNTAALGERLPWFLVHFAAQSSLIAALRREHILRQGPDHR